jgi:sporulation protein YlmC with PRC-barrel domain
MNRIRSIGIIAAFAALLVAPCQAQPAGQPGATSQKQAARVLAAGTAQKTQNNWRGRTLIGTAVFNDNGQRIATINDLLITDDGRVDQVVLAVRRMGGKLVAVPFNQLRFAPSSGSLALAVPDAPPTSLGSGDLKTYGAVLPGATRESLAKMETFRFGP